MKNVRDALISILFLKLLSYWMRLMDVLTPFKVRSIPKYATHIDLANKKVILEKTLKVIVASTTSIYLK